MRITKYISVAACSLLLAANVIAQDEPETQKKHYDPTNWFTGGSVSLGYGGGSSYSTFIAGLHPHFGYTLAKWIDVAAVVNFEYQSQKDFYNNKFRNTTYGVGMFTRIFPVHFLFVQAEPEYNLIKQKYIPSNGTSTSQNLHVTSFLVGGGYTTSRSDKNTFTYLSVLIDVVKNINSPYVDGYGNIVPIIRAGVNIGLNRGKRK
jgi:hypothetical protein